MKIEDILAPWEYNPNSPPKICETHHLSLLWNGEQRPAIVALISGKEAESDRYLAFRIRGDDANWTLGSHLDGRKETFFPQFTPSISHIEKRIELAMQKNYLIRQFVFEWNETPESECLVTLSASGFGFWDDARFHFPVANFFETRAQVLYEKLSVELENPYSDSDLLFARQFSLLGPSSRRARLLGLELESQLENHLSPLRSLWWLVVASHVEDVNMYHRQSNPPYRIAHLEVRGEEEEFSCQLDITTHPEDERLQMWANLIIQYGPIQVDYAALEKYTALRDFLQSHGYEIRAMFESPTAHERLEAKVQLLEWAKAMLPPEKYTEVEAIESLL